MARRAALTLCIDRCGRRGGPSPGADVAGVSPVQVQTCGRGELNPGADVPPSLVTHMARQPYQTGRHRSLSLTVGAWHGGATGIEPQDLGYRSL